MLTLIFALIGVAAYTYSNILMADGYVLHPLRLLLYKLEDKGPAGAWLAKPLGLCSDCFAGQVALWYSIFSGLAFCSPFFAALCIFFSIFVSNYITNYYAKN